MNGYEKSNLSLQDPEYNLVLVFILTGLEDQDIVISKLSEGKILNYKIKHCSGVCATPRKGWKGSNQLFIVIGKNHSRKSSRASAKVK